MSLAPAIALATSVFAATAFYATSPNCLWPSMRRWRRWSAACTIALSVWSIAMWIAVFGIGVGLCAMLGSCMLTMIVLPWSALLTSSPNAAATAPEND
jgi:hypothetical protein